ncbi:hypothetical protein VTL71DRAFT_12650 [Oculimacula yallundae]|uniref:Uncharacterized protein n=1 Tax=Oculimacula yallundae TaxID=86028 RepID=A0ABR4CN95_9HELO
MPEKDLSLKAATPMISSDRSSDHAVPYSTAPQCSGLIQRIHLMQDTESDGQSEVIAATPAQIRNQDTEQDELTHHGPLKIKEMKTENDRHLPDAPCRENACKKTISFQLQLRFAML